MIVKNEARIIRRCLDAALPHVDGYVVCDTGSTDDTIDVVKTAGVEHGVPGHVFQAAWQNFGHNRTLAASGARGWIESAAWSLADTYLLFLDADMVLHARPEHDRRRLDAPSYHVAQDDGFLRYHNLRLARLSHDWRCVGVTHEYWEAMGAPPPERLDTLWIQDVGDGGSKADKFERDIRLLTEALARDPGNVRSMFYLAQSYFDTGRWSDAQEWYHRRWTAGGWDEERWYARYREGLCLIHLGDSERAAGVLLEAFQDRPTRAEPLHALARHYRERGRNHLAAMIAMRGLEVPFPSGDMLFVARPVYDWQLWEEISIAAFYAGKVYHPLGLGACERLLARHGHDDNFYNYVARNEVFYLQPLPARRRGSFTVSPENLVDQGVPYACANPSLVTWRGGLWANIRLVNYRQEKGVSYVAPGDGRIRTRNLTLRLDAIDGPARSERQNHPAPDAPPPAPHLPVLGIEDMRWIVHDDRIWFIGTSREIEGTGTNPQMVLGRMTEDAGAVEHMVHVRYQHERPIEKNWVPLSRDGGLHLVYEYDPTVVLRVDPASGQTTEVARSAPPWRAARLRGSTPFIRAPGPRERWIAVAHEVVYGDERFYTHRFVELDGDLRLVARSAPFVFDHAGIEYASGIVALDDDTLVISYGFEDREARWIETSWDDALHAIDRGQRT